MARIFFALFFSLSASSVNACDIREKPVLKIEPINQDFIFSRVTLFAPDEFKQLEFKTATLDLVSTEEKVGSFPLYAGKVEKGT